MAIKKTSLDRITTSGKHCARATIIVTDLKVSGNYIYDTESLEGLRYALVKHRCTFLTVKVERCLIIMSQALQPSVGVQ